jgi:hypothetical protein
MQSHAPNRAPAPAPFPFPPDEAAAMKQIQLLDKYPVYVEELAKADTNCVSADQVIARLREQVEGKVGATFIGVFDHYAHVQRQPEGKIADDIKDSKHVLFCLSNAIPNALVTAVRPRAISVVELEDRFVISYLEAPVEAPNQVMAGWIEALRRQ